MTDAGVIAPPAPPEVPAGFEFVGAGQSVIRGEAPVEGRVRWLGTPQEVIDFVTSAPDVADTVVIVRGGTTTFLTPALNAGVRGVVTLQGAPESHLGILSREYGIPCVMSVAFTRGVRTDRGEIVPADGARIRLDISTRGPGNIYVEEGAAVDDSPVEEAAGMSPEMMAQIQALLANFQTEVPHGAEGDAIMRARLTTAVLDLSAGNPLRRLTTTETNELVHYLTWNEWDALSARATEGESGLIPRQEYEAVGILNSWFKHPNWLRRVEEAVGAEGVIAIGERARTEIGTKVNLLHLWAMLAATSFGRGIALELKLHDENFQSGEVVEAASVARRLYRGLWSGGGMFTSMRDYRAPVLEDAWIERFVGDRVDLAAEEEKKTFQRFNGAAELLGFLLHFDNRLGLNDHGPYPVPGGGFVMVRDLFVNEPAFPWSELSGDLPHAFTLAMFFPASADLEVKVTDLSTMFTEPANYLPFVEGVAVYARQDVDTPMDQLRVLDLADMAAMRERCEAVSEALYRHIAGMSTREKVLAGARVYTAGFALSVVRASGLYDTLADEDLFELHPAVEAAYDIIVSGVAAEMIPRLFLTGSWGNPVPENASTGGSVAVGSTEAGVLRTLKIRGFVDTDAVATSSGLDPADVGSTLETLQEEGKVKRRQGRLSGWSLTPTGAARAALLASQDVVAGEDRAAMEHAYADFLPVNRTLKALCTEWQRADGAADDGFARRLEEAHATVTAVVARAATARPHFVRYGDRLAEALARFTGGDTTALAKPMSNSYHDVWMELHEDLLVTLGRSRSDEDE